MGCYNNKYCRNKDFDLMEYLLKDIEEDKAITKLERIEYEKPTRVQFFTSDKIKNIYYNDEKGKEIVVVKFADGTRIVKKPAKGDNFDLNVGVALCIAEYMFGTKTQFHKFVNGKAAKSVKKQPSEKE